MIARGLASVRVRLALLVLLAVLPALALTLYTATDQRRRAAEDALDDARRQAVLAANDQAEQVAAARQLLVLLSRLPAIRADEAAACDALLARLLPQYPAYTNLTVLRPNGDAICSAPPAPPGLDLSDRAYFQRALATREFAAGDFIVGRISGQPSIDFAYPVLDPDGAVRQVLALGIDLTWLNRYLVDGEWPADTSLTVFDQSGTIVASYPTAARTGQARGDRPLVRMVLAQREGVAREVAGDGRAFLVGFATTDVATRAADVHVVVSIPEAVAFAPANRQLARNLALLGAAAALAMLAAWLLGERLIVQPVRRLAASAKRLSAGDLSARGGPPYSPGELGELGSVFDRMADELQRAYLATVQVLAAAADARDPSQLGHVERVAAYAVAIGRALGWDEPQLLRLQLAAILHDVGKIGVPDAVLCKPGGLTPDEQALVRTHPEAGARLLAAVPFLHPAIDTIQGHHERYDGAGYPRGLAGEAIPVEARVVMVADAFDVLTAVPPLGQGRAVADALTELRACAGGQFDPAVVAAVGRAVAAGALAPAERAPAPAGPRAAGPGA